MDEKTWRKERPLYSGVLRYFPDALLEVANVSFIGNQQHNPGEPLHWAKEKSTDEPDALARHLLEAGTRDTDGARHSAKVAWRALAMLQREIDAEKAQAIPATKPTWVSGTNDGDRGAYYYGTERACNHKSGSGYLCTLRMGHAGYHEATDAPGSDKWRCEEIRGFTELDRMACPREKCCCSVPCVYASYGGLR